MSQNRKPIPKTQKEISNGQINPYDEERGNPNKQNLNRGDQLSFKGDTVKPLSIGLEDIDSAILFYFNEVIKPFVITNGQRIPVPIIYGNPEKWNQIQADGYFRDKNGKMMSPLIVFKRDDLSKDRSIGNKLNINQPHLYNHFVKTYSKRNFYSSFDILNNIKPEKEQYAVVIPDYISLTYSCVIWTYYNDQMNKIVEAINYASDSYWGDPERFKFNAKIDLFNNNIEVSDGKDRIVKSTFEIKLNGYIIPDSVQKDMTAVKKIPDVTKVVWGVEATINTPPKPSL